MVTMNILYQFDDKYAPYAGVSIVSLLKNNKENDITVWCAAIAVSRENILKINKEVANYHQKIIWMDTKEAVSYIKNWNCGTWNGSAATWLKIFVLNQCQEIKRLLYLDCDLIVNSNISDLFHLDMKGNYVGAVLDSVGQFHCHRLNVDRYYNAGVILFDLEAMREKDMISGMKLHLKENIGNYPANDQDLLNDYFRDRILTLPMCYGFQGFHMLYDAASYCKVYHQPLYYTMQEIQKAQAEPKIIHFFRIFGNYPWEKNNIHPARRYYHAYLKESCWDGLEDIVSPKSIVFAIEKILYRILPKTAFLRLYRKIVER